MKKVPESLVSLRRTDEPGVHLSEDLFCCLAKTGSTATRSKTQVQLISKPPASEETVQFTCHTAYGEKRDIQLTQLSCSVGVHPGSEKAPSN